MSSWATRRPLLLLGAFCGALGAGLGLPTGSGLGPLPVAASGTVPTTPVIAGVAPRGLGALLSWTPNPASDDVTTYVAAATAVSASPPPVCAAPTPTTTSGDNSAVEVTGLCAAVAYTITLTAGNSAGSSAPSTQSNPVVPLPAQVPTSPLIVSVLGRDTSLLVAWSPPADTGGRPLENYTLKATGGGSTVTMSPAPSATQATITGLVDGTLYKLNLVASNAVGGSVAATSQGTPATAYPPTAPQNFAVVPDGSGSQVAATWAAPVDDGGSAITGFEVTYQQEVRNSKDTDWVLATGSSPTMLQAASTASSLTVGSLPAEEYFTFSITASNAAGVGTAARVAAPVAPTTQLTSEGVALTQSSMNALGSDVNGTLTWPSPAPAQVASLQIGNVIVGGTATAAPLGLIATVQSITQPSSGTYVVTTTPAKLSDAVKDLSLGAATNPLASGGTFQPAIAGLQTRPETGVGFSTMVTLSISAFAELGAVKVDVNGAISVTPTLSADLSLNQGFLGIPDGATLSLSAEVAFAAQISVEVSVSGDSTSPVGEIDIGDIYGPPIDLQVGPVPVVLRAYIPVYLSASGTIGFSAQASETIGGSLSWSSNDAGNLQAKNLSSPLKLSATPDNRFDQSVTGQVGLSIEPTIQIEGVADPYVKAFLGLQVSYDASGSPYFEIGPVLQLAAGFKINLLIFDAGFEINLTRFTFPVFTINKAPPPTLSVTPANAYVAPGQQQVFAATRSDGATYPVTWSLVGGVGADAISSSGGVFTPAAPAGRTLTIVAKDSTGLVGETTVTVMAAEFDPPQNLTASLDAAQTGATVSWTAPANTGGTSLVGYTLLTTPNTAVQSLPGSSTGATLTGLDPNTSYLIEVYATDSAGLTSDPATTLLQVGGWLTVASPSQGSYANYLSGVSCANASFCVAAGSYNTTYGSGQQNLIEQWNGSAWTTVASPNPGSSSDTLSGVSCASASFCVVAGAYSNSGTPHSLIEQWNGSAWRAVASPSLGSNGYELDGVSCASARFCVAAGYYDATGGADQTLIDQWNGSAWITVASPNPGPEVDVLDGVSCASANFCVAAGYYDTSGGGAVQTLIEQWNGSAWTTVASPSPGPTSEGLDGVSCLSAGFCVAAGVYYSDSSGAERTLIEQWNGSAWITVASPNPYPGDDTLSGVSCVSTSFCVAAGTSDNIRGDLNPTLIEQWNGSAWTTVPSPNPDNSDILSGVSCAGAGFCSAAGLHYGNSSGGNDETLIEQT